MTQGARTAPYAALRELMAARYVSVKQLAARMGVTEKRGKARRRKKSAYSLRRGKA